MDYSYKYTSDRFQYITTISEHLRLQWVRIRITECNATLCPFFIFLLFLTSLHLFTIAKHYFALILQYGVARCLFQPFFAETQFWSLWPIDRIGIVNRPLIAHLSRYIKLKPTCDKKIGIVEYAYIFNQWAFNCRARGPVQTPAALWFLIFFFIF